MSCYITFKKKTSACQLQGGHNYVGHIRIVQWVNRCGPLSPPITINYNEVSFQELLDCFDNDLENI